MCSSVGCLLFWGPCFIVSHSEIVPSIPEIWDVLGKVVTVLELPPKTLVFTGLRLGASLLAHMALY